MTRFSSARALIRVKVASRRSPRMRRDRVRIGDDVDDDGLVERKRALQRILELARFFDAHPHAAEAFRNFREIDIRKTPHLLGTPALFATVCPLLHRHSLWS